MSFPPLVVFLLSSSLCLASLPQPNSPCRCLCPPRIMSLNSLPPHCPAHSPCPQHPPCYSRIYTGQQALTRRRRTKRQTAGETLDEVVKVDTNCNSETLREIIIQHADRVTSVSKRSIQAAAEKELGGRYNVICARGDFSYITNTEIFCQQTVGDVTCYAFKQLSDLVAKKHKI